MIYGLKFYTRLFSLRHPEKEDTSIVIRQLLLTKLAHNRESKRRKLIHIQVLTLVNN